jgi:hypothetical protein
MAALLPNAPRSREVSSWFATAGASDGVPDDADALHLTAAEIATNSAAAPTSCCASFRRPALAARRPEWSGHIKILSSWLPLGLGSGCRSKVAVSLEGIGPLYHLQIGFHRAL